MSELALRAAIARVEACQSLDELQAVRDDIACGANGPGAKWVAAHPDEALWPPLAYGCCYGSANSGPAGCTCWEPVFDVDQADPLPFTADQLRVQPRMCGDCAYRKNSPERADPYMEEVLLNLPGHGELFYCHAGIRRPVLYRHPVLGDVPGDPSDYQPVRVGAVVFQADGTPALLCAGWAARHNQLPPDRKENPMFPTAVQHAIEGIQDVTSRPHADVIVVSDPPPADPRPRVTIDLPAVLPPGPVHFTDALAAAGT